VKRWINLFFYQATWVTAVVAAGHGLWWPGLLVLAAFSAWQLGVSPWPRADAVLMLALSALGFALDSLFVRFGLMHFASAVPWPGLAPVWMVALWTSFALSLNHSLAFLQQRPLLGAALGGAGSPFAYWVAANGWHALTLGDRPLLTLALVGAAWIVLMPLFAQLALRWRRFDTAPACAPVRGGA
jgi:hypothetical protein